MSGAVALALSLSLRVIANPLVTNFFIRDVSHDPYQRPHMV